MVGGGKKRAVSAFPVKGESIFTAFHAIESLGPRLKTQRIEKQISKGVSIILVLLYYKLSNLYPSISY